MPVTIKTVYYGILSRLYLQSTTHPNISKLWIQQLQKSPTLQTCQEALTALSIMQNKPDISKMTIAALYSLLYV